jgi:hypothetical protein
LQSDIRADQPASEIAKARGRELDAMALVMFMRALAG